MNAHAKRLITGIVGAPVLIAIICYGSQLLFSILITGAILVGTLEYASMVLRHNERVEKVELVIVALLIPIAFYLGNVELALAVVVFAFMTIFAIHLIRISADNFTIIPPMKVLFGIIYIPLTMSYFLLLRTESIEFVLLVLVIAMVGDASAFYVGKTWGKTKIYPMISPNKSAEGLFAIPVGALIGALIFRFLFMNHIPWYHIAIIAILGSLLGHIGDFCESMIKRTNNTKDSGTILPGHGGILDRIDCLIFIVPFVYYYKMVFMR
ncbi:MAG: phosphatidate cytidylyltransferase [Deltaproteobacteria bacterium]